jgi:hypothetical protein
LVPESIRWLITHNYYNQAKKLILKASALNGKTIPSHLLVIPTNQGGNQQLSDTVTINFFKSVIRAIFIAQDSRNA